MKCKLTALSKSNQYLIMQYYVKYNELIYRSTLNQQLVRPTFCKTTDRVLNRTMSGALGILRLLHNNFSTIDREQQILFDSK